MIIVKLQGGAGNQLFQASHVYASLPSKTQPVTCYTGALVRYGEKRALFDPAWTVFNANFNSGLLHRLALKLSEASKMFDRLLRLFNIYCIQGYFQESIDLDYATQVKAIVESSADLPGLFKVVIHCRGGDYFDHPNDTIYWQLSLLDYAAAIGVDFSGECAVIGNHQEFIKALSQEGAQIVQGSITDDLALMGVADRVICSNSTFACWGAAFCLLAGGEVSVPLRYYCSNQDVNPFDALAQHFPDRVTYFGVIDA